MIIIDWNISYQNSIQPKLKLLKSLTKDDQFILILQEVTPSSFQALNEAFPNNRYSLDYRKPGKYDTKSRQLGVVIAASDDIKIEKARVLDRCLFPDRTLLVDLKVNDSSMRIMGLHSITGCSHKKAKSIQFFSFAEAVDKYKPDIVGFDANEPKTDHYDVSHMEFFSNEDNGKGARTFFETLTNIGMVDAFAAKYYMKKYEEGKPLAVSHILNGKAEKRYDFLFVKKDIGEISTKYLYDRAIKAGGDHAVVRMEMK